MTISRATLARLGNALLGSAAFLFGIVYGAYAVVAFVGGEAMADLWPVARVGAGALAVALLAYTSWLGLTVLVENVQ